MQFFSVPLDTIRWAAQECARQESGELSVAWMLEGYAYALTHRARPITLDDILTLGRLIEPVINRRGLRALPVLVGRDLHRGIAANTVPTALAQLVEYQDGIDAVTWYRSYQEIHPFADGNGRTGSILYNWRNASLLRPVAPPALWR